MLLRVILPYVLYCIILLKDRECVCRTSEHCKSLVLQDKCNIEMFLSPDLPSLSTRQPKKAAEVFSLTRVFAAHINKPPDKCVIEN